MKSFQDIILTLQNFWSEKGCIILQPYDTEMGAGTFHPATTLHLLSNNSWNAAYVQPCRRPADGRYGNDPNRLQHYYQFQVILKPAPENAQKLYLESIQATGIDIKNNDIRFVEDDWESPTLGAWGLGWEVWCNGMEVSQFTYFQQMCGISCDPCAVELTYGLERLAMYIQKCDNVFDIKFNDNTKYGDIYLRSEFENSKFNFELSDPEFLLQNLEIFEKTCKKLISEKLALPAYDYCIKMSHIFNLLDARGCISATERPAVIARIRDLAKSCAEVWIGGSNRN